MSRRHDAKQRHEELTAFTLFAKLVEWDIQRGSIRQDIPDIACRLSNGAARELELVSLDAKHTLRRLSNFEDTQPVWDWAISRLPGETRRFLRERLDDASLGIHFVQEPDRRQMRVLFPEILERLLQLPPKQVGPIFPLDGKHKSVAWSKLTRGKSLRGGPHIVAVSGGRPQMTAWSRIKDKLQGKKYGFRDGVELLAYSRYDTLLPSVDDIVPANDIKSWLQGTPFSRVWILDSFMRTVEAEVSR
jgi:hypothetical protein